ncbi:MAG: hypothetical protein U9O78_03725, partial [Patescibacteria group bacterium]|nr:hypothetical protein [Patescibacteria group bacterium]
MKKIIPIVVVLFIILGGVGGYFLLNSRSTGNDSQTGQPAQKNKEKFSFKELLSRSQTTKCTFSGQDDQGQDFSGTIYVASDKKARQDYEYMNEGKKEQMHLIIKSGYVYMWTSMQPGQGMKMAVQESDEDSADFEANLNNFYGQNL